MAKEVDTNEEPEQSPLNLSDEEAANFNWDAFLSDEETEKGDEDNSEEEASDTTNESEVEEDVDTNESNESNTDTQNQEVETSQESDEVDKETTDDSGELEVDDTKANTQTAESDDVGGKPESVDEADKPSDKEVDIDVEPDYKQEYHDLLAPFKANGKMMQVENISDARTLMQMGANYNKKMAGLKPSLKIVRMLENHDLLDEAKINRLIDLDKKDPDAIKQLLKDSKLDVLEFDPEKDTNYKPNTYTVDDKEVEFDSILKDIRETESGGTTLNIISNKWDKSSQQALFNSPDIIPVINEHVASGIYEKVMAEVEKEKMLGRLAGLSDLEAYKVTGDALNAAGKFNKSTKPSMSKTTKQTVVDPKLKDKKRAASSTKNLAGKGTKKDTFNPLSLSDAEFDKLVQKGLA